MRRDPPAQPSSPTQPDSPAQPGRPARGSGPGPRTRLDSGSGRGRPIETLPTHTGDPDRPLHRADLALARRALAGEARSRAAFAERLRCVPRFLAARNAALGRPLGDEELGDLAQDVLVLLWTKLGSYAGKGSLETWAYRFCMLETMNALRRLRRRGPTVDPLAETGAEAGVEHDAGARLADEETEALLRHLSEREAEVVRLRHFEGLEAREVAERLGISLSSVKTHYYRALEKLRPLLAPRAQEERR